VTPWVAIIYTCFRATILDCDADNALDIDSVITYAATEADCLKQTEAFFTPRGKQNQDTKITIQCFTLPRRT
jgi:hypothetical protein